MNSRFNLKPIEYRFGKAEKSPCSESSFVRLCEQLHSTTMKKYICILASAALLAACEQKTETVTPTASPNASDTTTTTTTSTASPAETTTSPTP